MNLKSAKRKVIFVNLRNHLKIAMEKIKQQNVKGMFNGIEDLKLNILIEQDHSIITNGISLENIYIQSNEIGSEQ